MPFVTVAFPFLFQQIKTKQNHLCLCLPLAQNTAEKVVPFLLQHQKNHRKVHQALSFISECMTSLFSELTTLSIVKLLKQLILQLLSNSKYFQFRDRRLFPPLPNSGGELHFVSGSSQSGSETSMLCSVTQNAVLTQGCCLTN